MLSFTVRFTNGGVLAGDTTDPADVAQIGKLIEAKGRGHDHLLIGLEGGYEKTVGDIASIDVVGRW